MAVRFIMNDFALPRIQPMICGRKQCPPGWHVRRRDGIGYLMHYVLSGTGMFTLNGKTTPLRAGDLFICAPGQIGEYSASKENPYDYAWVKLECAKELQPYLEESVIHVPEASRLFIQIAASFNDPGQYFRVYGLVYQLFGILCAKSKQLPHNLDYVGQAMAYVQDNYASPIRIADLANLIGLERSYFCRLFRNQTGMSPQAYIVSQRLERAEELLRSTKLSQKEICKLVGYRDVYTFSRMFKRKYGIAPGKYRTCGEHYFQEE